MRAKGDNLLVRAFVIISQLTPYERELWYDHMVLERTPTELAVRENVTRQAISRRISLAKSKIRLLREVY